MTTAVESPRSSSVESPFPWAGLIVLATAVFMSVTAEMLPTGLLPEMSTELGVGEAQIGLLVTLFALAVVATSVPLAAITRGFSRHSLIVVVLLAVAGSSLLAALAPNYAVLAVARVLGGMAHGLFWAVVGAYSGHLVPRHQIGRAVAITTGGGTLAFVLGVPLGTVVGQTFGWRVPFAAIGLLAVCAAVLILKKLPRVANPVRQAADDRMHRPGLRARLDPSVPAVVMVCLTVATVMVGHYAIYTYIAPFMVTQMHVPAASVGALLFVYGAAGAIGLLLAGFVFGRRPSMGIAVGVAVTATSVAVMAVFSANTVVAVVAFTVWGAAFGLIPPLMQVRLLHVAAPHISDTANAFFSSSFNVGIATGAVLGGVLLSGLGVESLPFAYLLLLVVSGALLVLAGVSAHRRGAGLEPAPAGHRPALIAPSAAAGTRPGPDGSMVTVAEAVGPCRPESGSA
ncbi:MFS transporter [soil metagenome]